MDGQLVGRQRLERERVVLVCVRGQLLDRQLVVGQLVERDLVDGQLVGRQLLERERVELRVRRREMKDKLPLSARLVILAVAAEGLAIVILRILQVGRWNAHDLLAWAALVAGIVVAEQFTIPIRFRTETLNFSVTEGVWIAALILSRSSVLTLAVAVGILAGNTIRRWAAYKAAFNVGQFVLAVTVAQIVYGSFHVHGALHPGTWLATA